jgi:hypothetical protein
MCKSSIKFLNIVVNNFEPMFKRLVFAIKLNTSESQLDGTTLNPEG